MYRTVALALALVAIACGSKDSARPRPATPVAHPSPPAPRPEDEDPVAADAVAAAVRAHEILSSVSVVPAGSHVLCNAAMGAAAAAIGQPPEAVAWSGDSERDRALLRTRVAGVLRRARGRLPSDLALRLARAMAMAAKNPHVFALDAGSMATLLALVSGQKAAGLGFAAHAAGGRWVVADVYPGGPAAAAGIKRGDRLLELDGRPFDEQSHFASFLTVAGQRVALEAEMGGLHSPYRKRVELVAEPVARPIVESRLLGKGIGYIRIHYLPRSNQPQSDAAANVAGALGEHGKKISKWVVDLRDNAGGSPFDTASMLVRGNPLFQTQTPGKPPEPLGRTAPTAPALTRPHQVAVLVNGQSYSAAEMVALALQSHGEARVFGQPTGGALTVPGQEQLPGGVTLMFPGQLVLDASGKAPAGQRVTPDEVVASTTAEDMEAGVDRQLDAALAWLKKR